LAGALAFADLAAAFSSFFFSSSSFYIKSSNLLAPTEAITLVLNSAFFKAAINPWGLSSNFSSYF